MAGLIDAAAEAERLGKLRTKALQDQARVRSKLANENFVRNAPPEVVETERARDAELERTLASLTSQLERIRRLLQP
jgi:valyl-tRNA synthetase